MEFFKLEHFAQKYGCQFPPVRTLSRDECDRIRALVARRIGEEAMVDPLSLVRTLDDMQRMAVGVSAIDPTFDISRQLPAAARDAPSLLINWYRFDEIDEVDKTAFISFFHDIWYPSSDDIDIFDQTISWIVSIRHDGIVKCVSFSPEKKGDG